VTQNRFIRYVAAFCAVAALMLTTACSDPAGGPIAKAETVLRRDTSRLYHASTEASGLAGASEDATGAQPAADPSGSAGGVGTHLHTSNRWVGKSAAHALLGMTTAFPTVSIPPSWAGRFGGVINGVQTSQPVVALTFDDGPTRNTREIVNDLKAYGDHATFFWVGSRITTDAARYSVAAGEELANHTWNHPNMWKLSSAEASAEIGLTSARIAQFTGHPPVWFRSPFNRLFTNELAQIKAHRLLYANYDVTSVDWMADANENEILQKIASGLRPGGVILMHDSPQHDPAKFLPAVLSLLKARGYRVVTMSQLAQMGPPVNEPLTLGIQGLGY
jgi:peptidoglycan/xylan/chitin deacetylase (PgdA/CDA1 family)